MKMKKIKLKKKKLKLVSTGFDERIKLNSVVQIKHKSDKRLINDELGGCLMIVVNMTDYGAVNGIILSPTTELSTKQNGTTESGRDEVYVQIYEGDVVYIGQSSFEPWKETLAWMKKKGLTPCPECGIAPIDKPCDGCCEMLCNACAGFGDECDHNYEAISGEQYA